MNNSLGDAEHSQVLRILLALRVDFINDHQSERLLERFRASRQDDDWLTLDDLRLLDAQKRDILNELVALHLEAPTTEEKATMGTEVAAALQATSISDAIRGVLASPSQDEEESLVTTAGSNRSTSDKGERFVVKRELARGGLGTVYVAEDQEIPRDVALKEIPEQYASNPDFTRRFVMEAEVTGALEHPGIVPIYGMGRNDAGRPYYAMRLIRGQSLREAVDEYHRTSDPSTSASRLAFRRLLSQLVSVCHAIHYAHQRGVLHRDIKPDNIMLGANNETMVVDWGIAKITAEAPAELMAAGPPEPDSEQAEAETKAGDTIRLRHAANSSKTTVGTTVGTPAFMSPEQALGWNDTLSPASDVYSLGATLYYMLTGQPPYTGANAMEAVVIARTGEFAKPREVRASVPRALEAICLKAMSGTVQERYATPLELAEELEAYLADERVHAWREPISARLRRWFRHHRAALAGLVASVAMGLLMLTTISIVLTAANGRERRARREVEAQRDRANSNFTLARTVVDRYLIRIAEDPRLQEVGLEDLRKDLFAAAKDFYQDLVEQSEADAELSVDQAWATFRSAGIVHEIESPDAAVKRYREAFDAFERLDVPVGQANSAFNISLALRESGKADEAEKQLDKTIALCAILIKKHPGEMELERRAAGCQMLRGSWLRESGKLNEAVTALQAAMTTRERLTQQHGKDADLRAELAKTQEVMALVQQDLNDYATSAKLLERAKALRDQSVKQLPRSLFHRNALAANLTSIADLQLHQGLLDEAKQSYELAVKAQNGVLDAVVRVTKYRQRLAQTYNNQGALLATRGETVEAAKSYEASIRVNEALVGQRPNDPVRRKVLATSCTNLAELFRRSGDVPAAMKLLLRAQDLYTQLTQEDSDNQKLNASLVDVARSIGDIEASQSRFSEAEKSYASALKRLGDSELADDESTRFVRGELHNSLGMLYSATNRPAKARQAYITALAPREKLVKDTKGRPDYRSGLAATQANLANLAFRENKLSEADDWYTKAIETVRDAPKTHSECLRVHCASLGARGLVRGAQKRHADAIADLQAALKLDRGTLATAIRLNLARYLALDGQHAAAITHCRELQPIAKGAAQPLYRLAGSAALAIEAARKDKNIPNAHRAKLVTTYQTLAASLLRDAAQSGYFNTQANRKQLDTEAEWKAVQSDKWFTGFKKTLE